MRNVLRMVIALFVTMTIILILNGVIWWSIGSLFVWAFDIAYIWTFAKGFVVGLILFMLAPVNIKFNSDDLIKKISKEEGGDNIE